MSEMNEHYAVVLADLQTRRAKLAVEIQQIDAAISGLRTLIGQSAEVAPGFSPRSSLPQQMHGASLDSTRFSNVSVRWGVLWYLAEFAEGYVKTATIADALLRGGYKSKAAQFPNLVSAVLSNMKTKEEVEANSDDGATGYQLTEKGRQTWTAIRQGHKFRDTMAGYEQSLLH